MKNDSESKYLIDSNILVYAYDASEKEKRRKSLKILEECWNGKRVLYISVQNLSEFYFITTVKIQNPLLKTEARKRISSIVSSNNWIKLNILPSCVLRAIDFTIDYNIAYWDALIAATMLENNVNNIYTEDVKDFSKIPGIVAINPVK